VGVVRSRVTHQAHDDRPLVDGDVADGGVVQRFRRNERCGRFQAHRLVDARVQEIQLAELFDVVSSPASNMVETSPATSASVTPLPP